MQKIDSKEFNKISPKVWDQLYGKADFFKILYICCDEIEFDRVCTQFNFTSIQKAGILLRSFDMHFHFRQDKNNKWMVERLLAHGLIESNL